MTTRDPTSFLFVAAMGAVALMMAAVMKGVGGLILAPAAGFALLVVGVAMHVNRRFAAEAPQTNAGEDAEGVVRVLSRNSRIVGVAYGFSAMAMQALYLTPLTGLKWQHGWQYASAFALLAVTAFEYARVVVAAKGEIRARLVGMAPGLMIAQSVFAAGGLAVLALSGKIFSRRPDWAANVVFLFAALMVMVLGAIALRAHATMTER